VDEFVDEVDLNPGEVAEIEEGLRRGLKHVAAPEGFTDGVMARVAAREKSRLVLAQKKAPFVGLHRNAGVWTSIAAALVLAVGGGLIHTRHVEQEREAAQVQAQLDLAMELTGHALDHVQGNLDKSPAGQLLESLGK
jgi:hypothetical protein